VRDASAFATGPEDGGMADTYSSRLKIWDGWRADVALPTAWPATPAHPVLADDKDQVERLVQQETFLSKSRRTERIEPFSLSWFLEVEGLRYGRHNKWVPRLLEFGKHGGERLLGMGPGLGTDWAQYARHGAEVIACSHSAAELELVQRNFTLRGLRARFLHADPNVLPLETSSIDVACVTSLLTSPPAPSTVVQEVFRVLKPGGKILVVAPALHDADFWCNRWLPWRRRTSRTPADAWTGRGLRRLLDCFVELRISKRQLRRGELPHVLRWFPPSALERVMGRFLIVRAFKPLGVVIPVLAAA
jgi:SAM-dependent methyltransferase